MPNQEHEPVYVISVAARLAGLPCWVLRVLDQEGIVVPVRTDSNRRLYCDHDIALLARVRYLTEEQKVNIPGVKVILEMERERQQERMQSSPPGHQNGIDSSPILPSKTTTAIALSPYTSVPASSASGSGTGSR